MTQTTLEGRRAKAYRSIEEAARDARNRVIEENGKKSALAELAEVVLRLAHRETLRNERERKT